MKYQDWLAQWLYYSKPLLKTRSYERYCKYVSGQLAPKLGNYDLDELSTAVLKQFTTELLQDYSFNTAKSVILLMKRSLRNAEELGVVDRQYGDKINLKGKISQKKARKPFSFTLAQQRRLENYVFAQQATKLYGILLLLYTGLRIGELLALKWSDIDFRRNVLTVTKSCHDSYQNGAYVKVIDTPKTDTSEREIPLPKQLIPYLKQLKKQNCSGYVIEGKDGKLVSMRSYEATFGIILQKLDLPHAGPHALRHTFATRALECGMDVKTLSELLGHSDVSVTLRIYFHCLPEHKLAMMNKLGKMLQERA